MKPVDWDIVPDDGTMILLTTNDIIDDANLYIADFKDLKALIFKPTRSFVGLTRTRGIRLGKGPPRMINGIWYVDEDPKAQAKHKNIELTPELVSLVII
jgi:hypothetical protein